MNRAAAVVLPVQLKASILGNICGFSELGRVSDGKLPVLTSSPNEDSGGDACKLIITSLDQREHQHRQVLLFFFTLCIVCFLRLPSCFCSVMESADSRKMSSTYCRTFALAKLAKPEDFAEVIALVLFEEFTTSFATLIGPAIPSNPPSVPICVKVRVDGRAVNFKTLLL